MPFKLNVPYSEKDVVKSKGAFWNAELKFWYVPDHKNINDFLQWIDTEKINIIIKSPFYLGVNSRKCWKCNSETLVFSIYSNNFYDLDNYENEEEYLFYHSNAKSFFSNITYLDKELATFFVESLRFFKFAYSKTAQEKYWINHCEKCHSLQGDFFNHSEPSAPFYPITKEECKKILLVKLPFRFDIGISGDYSISSNDEEVFELSKKIDWEEFINNKQFKNRI